MGGRRRLLHATSRLAANLMLTVCARVRVRVCVVVVVAGVGGYEGIRDFLFLESPSCIFSGKWRLRPGRAFPGMEQGFEREEKKTERTKEGGEESREGGVRRTGGGVEGGERSVVARLTHTEAGRSEK